MKALNLHTDDLRELHHKAVERRRIVWDMVTTRKAANLFNAESRRVIAKLRKAGLPSTREEAEKIIASGINTKAWSDYFIDSWRGMINDFGRDMYMNLMGEKGYKPSETKAFNPWNAIIKAYVIKMAATKVTWVTDFTRSTMGGIIMNILDKPEHGGMDEVAKRIKDTYSDMSRYRAYRIGRTEVAGASNYGSMQAARQTGLVLYKEWITSRDPRVRDEHVIMHGEAVRENEKFSNGLDYPAEYGANRPSQTINCRCVLAYRTEE